MYYFFMKTDIKLQLRRVSDTSTVFSNAVRNVHPQKLPFRMEYNRSCLGIS